VALALETAAQARSGKVTAGWAEVQSRFGMATATAAEFVATKAVRDFSAARAAKAKPAGEGSTDEDGSDPLADRWVRLGDAPELILDPPPEREWLLTQTHEGCEIGMFARGTTGLLASTGGVGKTYALIDLAVAVAAGDRWLGTFSVSRPGHVLLALGEEDLAEARRRIDRVLNARRIAPTSRREIAKRLDLLPLAGTPTALTTAARDGKIEATEHYDNLVSALEQRGVEWSLIILDPLSRWAGGGVELDNEAATRFVQIIETLTNAPGNPAVMVAHHSSKAGAREGAADARGVSGIRDGVRWMATLDPVDNGAKLKSKKSNYSRAFADLTLVRSTVRGCEGTLRVATPAEAAEAKAAEPDSDNTIRAKVRLAIQRNEIRTKDQIVDLVGARREAVLSVVSDMLASKDIRRDAGKVFHAMPEPKH